MSTLNLQCLYVGAWDDLRTGCLPGPPTYLRAVDVLYLQLIQARLTNTCSCHLQTGTGETESFLHGTMFDLHVPWPAGVGV